MLTSGFVPTPIATPVVEDFSGLLNYSRLNCNSSSSPNIFTPRECKIYLDCHLLIYEVPTDPDGYPRSTIGIFQHSSEPGRDVDRPSPGQVLKGKRGETMKVLVENHLNDQVVSLHFHGLHMKNNAWMDGAHMVTECGIPPGGNFQYVFNLTQTGTYWYHSHAGVQYSEGLLGAIIVDYPDNEIDPVKAAYPYVYDYPMILQDWFHDRSADLLLRYNGPRSSFKGFIPNFPWPADSLLMNGRGFFDCERLHRCTLSQCLYQRHSFYGDCTSCSHPPDEYMCSPNGYTRMRLINGASNLPLRFWIDYHDLIIVARDGVETQPVRTKYLTIPVGQRLDVMIECNSSSDKMYTMWTSVTPHYIPASDSTFWPSISTFAYLRYNNLSGIEVASPELPLDVPLNSSLFGDDITREFRLAPLVPTKAPPADKRLEYWYSERFDDHAGHPNEYWVINNQSFLPPTQPMLQTKYLNQNISFINSIDDDKTTIIETLELGKVYEVVFFANQLQQHPWHLHGFTVWFIGYGRNVVNDSSWRYDSQPGIPALNEEVEAISVGDTWTVLDHGYVVFRFRADNPGPWFMHCHVEWHLAQGMAMLFSVENGTRYDGMIPPPDDFPTCGRMATWQNIPKSVEQCEVKECAPQKSETFSSSVRVLVSLFTLATLCLISI